MEFENTVMKVNQDIPWKIYVSRALSAWDDRLWFFGAGIFMVALDPDEALGHGQLVTGKDRSCEEKKGRERAGHQLGSGFGFVSGSGSNIFF